MSEVKVGILQRDTTEVNDIEEIIPASDIVLARGLKVPVSGGDMQLTDDANGTITLTDTAKVKVSSNDTTRGYLNGKLVAGTNITLTENNDGANETLTIAATGGGDFGSEFYTVENLAEASTNSTTYIQRLRISATGMTAGYKYILMWNYTWRYTGTSNDFHARIQLDDTTDLWIHDQEPKDIATTQRDPASGFAVVTGLSGSHTFDLDWDSETAAETAYIYNARMTLWRVA